MKSSCLPPCLRNFLKSLAIAACTALVCGHGPSVEAAFPPGISEWHVTYKSVDERIYIMTPADYDPGGTYPMVFAFNGTLVGENSWMDVLGPAVEKYKYIIVNPSGDDVSADPTLADYIHGWMQEQANIDLNRVYAMGSSAGGLLSIQLALRTSVPRYLAAIAPVAGELMKNQMKANSPTIPLFQTNGEKDTVIPYNGDALFESSLESARIWAEHNGITTPPVVTNIDLSVPGHGLKLTSYSAPGCNEVIQCTALQTGHSVLRLLSPEDAGVIVELIWQFYERNRLDAPYTVAFQTDGTAGAILTGLNPQTINYGADGSPVTANAPPGWHFVKWTKGGVDYSTAKTLTVTHVTEDMSLVAVFTEISAATNWSPYD